MPLCTHKREAFLLLGYCQSTKVNLKPQFHRIPVTWDERHGWDAFRETGTTSGFILSPRYTLGSWPDDQSLNDRTESLKGRALSTLCLTMTKQCTQATSGAFTNHEIVVSYNKLQCKISDESLTDTNRRLHLSHLLFCLSSFSKSFQPSSLILSQCNNGIQFSLYDRASHSRYP